MNLKERLSHFWNDTLGVDCPEQENIEESKSPEHEELIASLARVNALAEKYRVSSSPKGGKGNSGKIVKTVVVDPRIAAKAASTKNIGRDDSREER